MTAQQQDVIELEDLGDATVETRQWWYSPDYADSMFGRGFYPGWLESSIENAENRATF
jgi:hypothetical protein